MRISVNVSTQFGTHAMRNRYCPTNHGKTIDLLWRRNIFRQKIGGFNTKSDSYSFYIIDGDVFFSAFQHTDIRAMDAGGLSQNFLR